MIDLATTTEELIDELNRRHGDARPLILLSASDHDEDPFCMILKGSHESLDALMTYMFIQLMEHSEEGAAALFHYLAVAKRMVDEKK